MNVLFIHNETPRERLLAEAFLAGARQHGHTGDMIAKSEHGEDPSLQADVACMVGVKSRALFEAYRRRSQGARIVYLDKGYQRHRTSGPYGWEYWRMALDAHQPTRYVAINDYPADRLKASGLKLRKWRKRGSQIVIAGSSAKYHAFHDLGHPTEFARMVFRDLRALTDRPVVYRPKPSWREAEPIRKCGYSDHRETLGQAMDGAWAMVTHGSNSSLEAVLAGVPVVVLGDAVAKPISSTSLAEIRHPRMAGERERRRWLANVLYWQWTLAEMQRGEAWQVIEDNLFLLPKG